MRLANALIAATPESWPSAILELVVTPTGLGSGLEHCIYNPDFPRDFVTPTDEIYSATIDLETVCSKHGDSWTRCIFSIQQDGDDWGFKVKFER